MSFVFDEVNLKGGIIMLLLLPVACVIMVVLFALCMLFTHKKSLHNINEDLFNLHTPQPNLSPISINTNIHNSSSNICIYQYFVISMLVKVNKEWSSCKLWQSQYYS